MLLISGALTNIPRDLYEASVPMVLHQVAPSLVMTFAHNFNNFGAIFLLLTLDFQQYQIASVISIVIFLFLSGIAIWQFRRMKSFKDDVGM